MLRFCAPPVFVCGHRQLCRAQRQKIPRECGPSGRESIRRLELKAIGVPEAFRPQKCAVRLSQLVVRRVRGLRVWTTPRLRVWTTPRLRVEGSRVAACCLTGIVRACRCARRPWLLWPSTPEHRGCLRRKTVRRTRVRG